MTTRISAPFVIKSQHIRQIKRVESVNRFNHHRCESGEKGEGRVKDLKTGKPLIRSPLASKLEKIRKEGKWVDVVVDPAKYTDDPLWNDIATGR
jgi:hypothetical protein